MSYPISGDVILPNECAAGVAVRTEQAEKFRSKINIAGKHWISKIPVAEHLSGEEQKVLPLRVKPDFCHLHSPLHSRSAVHRSTLRSASPFFFWDPLNASPEFWPALLRFPPPLTCSVNKCTNWTTSLRPHKSVTLLMYMVQTAEIRRFGDWYDDIVLVLGYAGLSLRWQR